MNKIIKIATLVLLFLSIKNAYSQSKTVIGKVVDEYSIAIPNATVYIKENKELGTITNVKGEFSLNVYKGKSTLFVSYLGYKNFEQIIEVNSNKLKLSNIVLKGESNSLNEVVVEAKTKADIIKEQAFEVEVLETKKFKNNSVDVNGVLDKVPGVNIRKSGGLGSDFNFSLNGLTGKKVKFFIDDIPVTNFGSSYSFNNFPVNLIEHIEVYKGVVPVHLGADALGGAINIKTTESKSNFIDASYSIGSFNTHIAAINGQYISDKNFIFKLSSFYNYSDNNYKIDGVDVRDNLGNNTGETADNVERFHDAYDSQYIDVQLGVIDKSYADKLIFGFTASGNKNEIQHSLDPQDPFGDVFTKNNVIKASLNYENKQLLAKKLKLKLYASVARNVEKIVDTSDYNYDWFGGRKLNLNTALAELSSTKTLFEFEDDLLLINASTSYKINNKNDFSLNYVKDYISRTGDDPLSTLLIPFSTPNVLDKNIIGAAYNLKLFNNSWVNTVFGKGYFTDYKVVNEDVAATNQEERLSDVKEEINEYGYGLASTFKLSNLLQFKASFEKTYRIPDGFEIFGDGLLLLSNVALRPEESYNYNFGVLLSSQINKLGLKFDGNFFHRKTTDFINLVSVGATSMYQNVSNANSTGGEAELSLNYNKKWFLNINSTYQDIINQNGLTDSRIPNIPYFFGNLSLGTSFKNILSTSDNLSISFDSSYTHEFNLQSETAGNANERFVIESQLSHNVNLGYSFNEGVYNVSLTASNISDEQLYDNFRIQQPGRAFYVKFRYFLSSK